MQKVTINKDRLVAQSVVGKIHHPTLGGSGVVKITHDGKTSVLPSVGGITYNVKIGDSVYGMDCDHVEPGVSIKNPDARENGALNAFACVGNDARVVSGDAKGAKGFVTGTHGGIEHVLLHFGQKDLEKMLPDDRILIRAWGQGLSIQELPEISVMSLDPRLFERIGPKIRDGKLLVPVAAKIPAHLMGAGQGMGYGETGDYDLMTSDWAEIEKYGLDRLRYGDLVLLEDCDNTFGRTFRRGAVTVGFVVHSDCVIAGHGPGVTTVMTCSLPLIEGVLSEEANLAGWMKSGGKEPSPKAGA